MYFRSMYTQYFFIIGMRRDFNKIKTEEDRIDYLRVRFKQVTNGLLLSFGDIESSRNSNDAVRDDFLLECELTFSFFFGCVEGCSISSKKLFHFVSFQGLDKSISACYHFIEGRFVVKNTLRLEKRQTQDIYSGQMFQLRNSYEINAIL